jgi:hypothetical protein
MQHVRRGFATLVCALSLSTPAVAFAQAPPVVWVQAGHEGPREPGYRDQTGAGSGPFGSEVEFNRRTAKAVITKLVAAGVDARSTPGLVTPYGSRGATFISIHHDAPGGSAAVGHALASGGGENYYHGEGGGDASPTPYADSAPHRPATSISATVERRSLALATKVAGALGKTRIGAGARAPFLGVVAPGGNRRMMHFYGYYRTRSEARILVECGAAGADDAFLARTDLIATSLSGAIVADLKARGLLSG